MGHGRQLVSLMYAKYVVKAGESALITVILQEIFGVGSVVAAILCLDLPMMISIY